MLLIRWDNFKSLILAEVALRAPPTHQPDILPKFSDTHHEIMPIKQYIYFQNITDTPARYITKSFPTMKLCLLAFLLRPPQARITCTLCSAQQPDICKSFPIIKLCLLAQPATTLLHRKYGSSTKGYLASPTGTASRYHIAEPFPAKICWKTQYFKNGAKLN